MRRTLALIPFALILAGCGTDPEKFPDSTLSYDAVDAQVGCRSTFSDAKKQDMFDQQFKNKWYRWTGIVLQSDTGSAELDLNGGGVQDLSVDFDSDNAGYNLQRGQQITVSFVLDSLGGCIIPYGGKHGAVVVNPPSSPPQNK